MAAGPNLPPAPAERREQTKFYIDAFLAVIAVVSVILNIYQYQLAKRVAQVEQPGPLVDQLSVRAIDGEIIRSALVRDPAVVAQLPNCSVVETAGWLAAAEQASSKTPIEKQRLRWHFLVLRNLSKGVYRDVSVETGGKVLASLPTMVPSSTALVYLDRADVGVEGTVAYKVAGTEQAQSVRFSTVRPSQNKLVLASQLAEVHLFNQEGLDDRTKGLVQSLHPGPIAGDK